MLTAASAVSKRKESFAAGQEAAQIVVDQLSCPPDIMWVFSAASYEQIELLKGIRSVSNKGKLIGCTTDGEISISGLSTESVVVLSLVSDTVTFHTTSVSSLSNDSYLAGVKIGRQFAPLGSHFIQIFSDGLTGNAVKIIEGIQSVLGQDIMISGATSGDGGQFVQTFQFHNDQVLTDSIVAVAYEGAFQLGCGVGCGWFPIGTAKEVTRSQGSTVYELDGKPALQVYEKFLGRHADLLPSVGVEYPLKIIDLGRQHALKSDLDTEHYLCRAVMAVDREEKSITFAGDVPQGSLVKMTMGGTLDAIEGAKKAAEKAMAEFNRTPSPHPRSSLSHLSHISPVSKPAVLFIFSCMARKIVLGSRTDEELSPIRTIVGEEIPTIGFYSYGEYAASTEKRPSCFQNETIIVNILGG